MKRITAALVAISVVVSSSIVVGQDGQEVFKTFSDFIPGGTWTFTNRRGEVERHTYRRILGGKFLELRTSRYVNLVGVDPKTNQCVYWKFTVRGHVGTDIVRQEADNIWVIENGETGPGGLTVFKTRVTKLDEDTAKLEHFVLNDNGQYESKAPYESKRKAVEAEDDEEDDND